MVNQGIRFYRKKTRTNPKISKQPCWRSPVWGQGVGEHLSNGESADRAQVLASPGDVLQFPEDRFLSLLLDLILGISGFLILL